MAAYTENSSDPSSKAKLTTGHSAFRHATAGLRHADDNTKIMIAYTKRVNQSSTHDRKWMIIFPILYFFLHFVVLISETKSGQVFLWWKNFAKKGYKIISVKLKPLI